MSASIGAPRRGAVAVVACCAVLGPHAMNLRLRSVMPLLFAMALVVACGEDSGPPVAALVDVSRIAFVSDRDGYRRIYLMDPDGSNQHALTDPLYGDDSKPVWSPDGTRIAFISDRSGNEDIHVIDADGGNRRNLTNSRDLRESSAAWSPDGTSIAFATQTVAEGYGMLYAMDADGGNVRALADSFSYARRLGWSPDGASLVYDLRGVPEGVPPPPVLGLSDAAGENERIIGSREDSHDLPEWSPDGLWIATNVADTGRPDIMIMDAEGGSRRTITRNPWVRHQWPTWSPDGKRIAFAAGVEAPVNIHARRFEQQSDIHVVDLDDLSVRKLTNSRDFDGMPAWSPRLVTEAVD